MNTQISKNFSFVYVIFFQMETVSHKLNQAINTLNPCRQKILKGHINYITKMLPVHIITEILVHVLKWWNANTHVIHVDNKLKNVLLYIFNWPSGVKGDLHWLFCSATVVGAEMLAERELSGPADHWMALANEGKRLRPFNLRDYAALYLYWNRYKVCNSRILTIIIFQQKRWWKYDFQTFTSCLITYTMFT